MKLIKRILKLFGVFLLLLCLVGGLGYWYFTKKFGKKERPNYELALGRNGSELMRLDWKFIRKDIDGAEALNLDDSKWKKINLPHTWNNKDAQDGGDDYFRGIGWYRKTILLDDSHHNKNLFLHFGAAGMVADVYVNGAKVGRHTGMSSAFRFDITPHVKLNAENTFAVKVDNSYSPDVPPLSGDWNFYGGLHREVYLVTVDPLHFDLYDCASPGVYLTQESVSKEKAEISFKTKVYNTSDSKEEVFLKVTVFNAEKQIVSEETRSFKINPNTNQEVEMALEVLNPHLWNGLEDPYLYQVRAEMISTSGYSDWVEEPLGIRTYSVDPEKGFFLNGKSYPLRGVNRHGDWLNMGTAIHPSDTKKDAEIIQEIGANAVRVAHYQQPEYFYDLLDSLGMVVWAEHSLVDDISDSKAFKDNTFNQMTELIKQNYNHPSIVMWSLANELGLRSKRDPNDYVEFLTELDAHAKEIDSTRLTVLASHNDALHPINFITDLISFNKYFGWYHGKFEEFGPFLDEFHNNSPQFPMGISEYGAGSSIDFHSGQPEMQDHTEEWANLYHEAYFQAIDERPYIWGSFVWNLFDFAVDKRDEGDQAGRNDKGLVTYDRKTKKDAFYYYKANWSKEPFTYITSRRWTERRKPVTDIKVYSNQKEVELFVNEVSIGIRKVNKGIAIWKQVQLKELQESTIKVVSIENIKVSDEVKWKHIQNSEVHPKAGLAGVDRKSLKIFNVPDNLRVDQLKQVIEIALGASYKILAADKTTLKESGTIEAGMWVEFVSESGENVVQYLFENGNLAQGKLVKASGELKEGQFGAEAAPATYLVDNDVNTSWSSGSINFPQWVLIDLGANYFIESMEIQWPRAQNTAMAKIVPGAFSYSIELSAATNNSFNNFNRSYDKVVERIENNQIEFNSEVIHKMGRFVKVNVLNSKAFSEVKMLNQKFPVCAIADLSVCGGLIHSDVYKIDYENRVISGVDREDDEKLILENLKSVEGCSIFIDAENKLVKVSGNQLAETYVLNW